MHAERLQCLHFDEEQPLDSLRARLTSHQYFPKHTKAPPRSYTHNRREPAVSCTGMYTYSQREEEPLGH
jgi:hypothetical protein